MIKTKCAYIHCTYFGGGGNSFSPLEKVMLLPQVSKILIYISLVFLNLYSTLELTLEIYF
jgi:hypothetical protein